MGITKYDYACEARSQYSLAHFWLGALIACGKHLECMYVTHKFLHSEDDSHDCICAEEKDDEEIVKQENWPPVVCPHKPATT